MGGSTTHGAGRFFPTRLLRRHQDGDGESQESKDFWENPTGKEETESEVNSKGTPTCPWSIPQASPNPQMKGIPKHKLLVGGRFGMFQGYVGKLLDRWIILVLVKAGR